MNSIHISIITLSIFFFHSSSFGMGLSLDGGTAISATTVTASYLTSIPVELGEPARIAIDSTGLLYVSVPEKGTVIRLSPDGSERGAVHGFQEPLALAVSSSQKLIYVGDVKDGSVKAINPQGAYVHSLGKGRGEFGMPADIAVASDGTILVTDSTNDIVKAYHPDGTFRFSFGGSGTSLGQMIFPTGIAVDDVNNEIYVVDHTNGRVEVFDLFGAVVRSFSGFGGRTGNLTRPQGIWISSGQVFVADAFQSNVAVFDRNGASLGKIGQYGSDAGQLKIPKDLAMSGGKLFVSNAGNRRIEVFTPYDPLGMRVEPPAASFMQEIVVTPASQTFNLTPQAAGAAVPWTASVSAPFSILLSQAAGTAPSAVTMTADAGNLAPGTYFGGVIFRANNTEYPVSVSMTVVTPRVTVTPSSLSMFYQIGGELTTKSLAVTSSGTASWTASVNVPWLSLSPSAGSTPASITVSLNQGIAQLPEGLHSAAVTVSASGGAGTLAVVPVSVKVARAGTIIVSMNIDAASAAISGAGTYTVSGKTLWRTDEAKPGTYTIVYGPVKGYRRPVSRTFELQTGQKVFLEGWYRELRTANVIAVAKGPGPENDPFIQLMDWEGVPVTSFKAFDASYGARIALGDLDGDGSDEVIAAPGPGPENAARIHVFHSNGTPLASTQSLAGTKYGAQVAVGDSTGRGRSIVAMSSVDSVRSRNSIVLYALTDGHDLVEKARIESSSGSSHYPAPVAFGDVNHDGRLELVVVVDGRIEIYGMDDAVVPTLLAAGSMPLDAARSKDYKAGLTAAAGDLDGDEVDEIIIGYEKEQGSYFRVFKGDLRPSETASRAFEKGKSSPTLSARDADGDGKAEILAGQGANPANDGLVRIFGPNGEQIREIKAPGTYRYGTVVSFGTVKK